MSTSQPCTIFQAVTVLRIYPIPSRTLEFAPHALPHIFDFTCLLTTTSDSFIVRAVGVEPTILTTIGVRILSCEEVYLPRYLLYRSAGKDLLLFSGLVFTSERLD